MTVETTDTVSRTIIDGTGPYEFEFRIFDVSELRVSVGASIDPTLLALNTHYTVSGVNSLRGGAVTLTDAVATEFDGMVLDIRSNTRLLQPSSIRNLGAFLPGIHEDNFDRLQRQVQDINRIARSALRYPDDGLLDGAMGSRTSWADRWVYVNSQGVFEPAQAINPQPLTQSIVGAYIHPLTESENATGAVIENYNYPPYHLFRYVPAAEINPILNRTSTYDATDAFQMALDAACETTAPSTVILPAGKINVTFIDCTNTRVPGTIQRDGVMIVGAGQFATFINGSPGNNRAVIDISGSQGAQLRHLTITGVLGSVGAGIFTGSSTLQQQSHQQLFEKVYISIPSDPAANGGNGTVGFWNFGSEENTHVSCYYEADRAAIFTANSSAPFPYLTPVNPLPSVHSCGVNTVNASLKSVSTAPALTTVDVGSFNFNGYLLTAVGGIGHLVQGALVASEINAIIEEAYTQIDVQGAVIDSTYKIATSTYVTNACIRMRADSAIQNSEIDLFVTGPINKQLISADVASSTTVVNTYIKNTTFRTNLDKAYILNGNIQFAGTGMAYVLKNSSDVHFKSSNYEYSVYQDRHVLRVPEKTTSLSGAASPATAALVKAVIPNTGISNQRGCAAVIEFDGAVTAPASEVAMWGAKVRAYLPFYADYITAGITAGTASGTVDSKVAQTAGSFDVSSVTMTSSVSGNEITATLSVARSGSAGSGVQIRGTVTLWQHYTSVAATSLALV